MVFQTYIMGKIVGGVYYNRFIFHQVQLYWLKPFSNSIFSETEFPQQLITQSGGEVRHTFQWGPIRVIIIFFNFFFYPYYLHLNMSSNSEWTTLEVTFALVGQ